MNQKVFHLSEEFVIILYLSLSLCILWSLCFIPTVTLLLTLQFGLEVTKQMYRLD